MYKISLAKKVFISLFMLVLFSKPSPASEKLAPVPMLRDKQGRDAETGSAQVFVQLGHSE